MGLMIGRKKELDDLAEYCRSGKAELICVYGRRRVGKTYLVENAFGGSFAFSATGSEDKRVRTQLKVFHSALREFGCRERAMPADWFEAFRRLRDVLELDGVVRSREGRRVVFLDEFPWFATKRSDFLFAFADFWNRWASKRDDVAVIVCGSATSWIIKNLFENTGSLYNRVTRQIYVAPFTLHEVEQMAESLRLGWSRDAILQCYMVFGGLPYYINMLDRRKSLPQNIDALCLDVHAPLRREVPHLMEATLGESPLHRAVLRALSESKAGIRRKDLAAKLSGGNSGTLKRALDDLEKCGYIRKYKNRYEKHRPTVYQLIDPFLLFSFHFIEGKEETSWQSFSGTPAYYAWRGNAFEIACLCHIQQLKHAIGISAVRTECFPWTSSQGGRGAQVDLVIERADKVTNLCEMKYTDCEFSIDRDYEESLRRKKQVFQSESGTGNAVLLTLVSAHGLKGNAHSWDIAATVTADDLFAF